MPNKKKARKRQSKAKASAAPTVTDDATDVVDGGNEPQLGEATKTISTTGSDSNDALSVVDAAAMLEARCKSGGGSDDDDDDDDDDDEKGSRVKEIANRINTLAAKHGDNNIRAVVIDKNSPLAAQSEKLLAKQDKLMNQLESMQQKGWRSKKKAPKNGKKAVRAPSSLSSKSNRKLAKRLCDLSTKDEECKQLVEGFDLLKSPRYSYFLKRMDTAGKNALGRVGTNRERQILAETILLCDELNKLETTLNIGTAVVESNELEVVKNLGDGYDEYLIAKTTGVREIWCGRSSAFGTGPLVNIDLPEFGEDDTTERVKAEATATTGEEVTDDSGSCDEDEEVEVAEAEVRAATPPPPQRICPVHSDKKTIADFVARYGASALPRSCTCHYSVCIVCFWGPYGMQQLKNKTGGVIPQGYSADTIRQVRYLPDNIGIVLFGAAKVMDRLHYTAKTLPRLCRTDMMLQIDMEERIDAVREEMKEALMQGGGYKDAMDLCEEELQNILKTTITLARKRAKEVGGSHGSSPSLSSGLGGAKGSNGPHSLGSSFNFGPGSLMAQLEANDDGLYGSGGDGGSVCGDGGGSSGGSDGNINSGLGGRLSNENSTFAAASIGGIDGKSGRKKGGRGGGSGSGGSTSVTLGQAPKPAATDTTVSTEVYIPEGAKTNNTTIRHQENAQYFKDVKKTAAMMKRLSMAPQQLSQLLNDHDKMSDEEWSATVKAYTGLEAEEMARLVNNPALREPAVEFIRQASRRQGTNDDNSSAPADGQCSFEDTNTSTTSGSRTR